MNNRQSRINQAAIYFAVATTIFGTSFVFIPISKNFSQYLGIGTSWALVLFIMQAPIIFLSKKSAELANNYGVSKVIMCSEIFAGLSSILLLSGIYYNNLFLTVVGLILVSIFSKQVVLLFPSYLNLLSATEQDIQKYISNWKTIRYTGMLMGYVCGGILYEHIVIESFIFVDMCTFIVAAILWFIFSKKGIGYDKIKQTPFWSTKEFVMTFFKKYNLFIFIKKFLYGIFNPLMAVIMLEKLNGGTAKLGFLYVVICIASLIGSSVAKRLSKFYVHNIVFTIIETIAMIIAVFSSSIMLFYLAMGVCSISMAISDTCTITLYLAPEEKNKSNYLTSIHTTTITIAMLIGFLFFIILSSFSYSSNLVASIILLFMLGAMTVVGSKNKNYAN